jgi:NAD(P)-dependent dehydrogenase (short-subunit alcohol dehydrogenase family)
VIEDFRERCAVITGGGGLLGRGLALALARRGANVVVAGLHEANAAETVELVRSIGTHSIAVETDVTDEQSMQSLADRAFAEFGAVHLLVNMAGARQSKPFLDLTRKDWDATLSVHLGGVINSLLAFLPRLREQDGERHIVNVSSMAGIGLAELRASSVPYATAKSAMITLSEAVAPTLSDIGIGVSVACPGLTMEDPMKPVTIMGQLVDLSDESIFPPSKSWSRDNVLTPDQVAQEIIHAVRENRLYVFPHRSGRAEVEERVERILNGFDQAERTSPPRDADVASDVANRASTR